MPKAKEVNPSGRRVAIVGGLRTPFVKSATVFRDLSPRELGQLVVTELLARQNLSPQHVGLLVYGQVVPSVEAPNIAREIVLGTDLPVNVDAYSVSRACATGTQAIVSGASSILLGETDCAIVGGADSLSRPPIGYRDKVVDALMSANSARSMPDKLKPFMSLKPMDLLPKPPSLTELSTGLTMGQSAEKMGKENGIERGRQDQFALDSHRKAARAWEEGIFDDEVMRVQGPGGKFIHRDGFPRPDTSLDKLARLKPSFDKAYGTVTAGNSSALTDGASALLLMEEKRAKELGYTPLAYIKSWAFAGLDPAWQLLMGPSFAVPLALDRAGLSLDELSLIDIHEAFAVQVLSNIQAWGDLGFAQKYLGRDKPIGALATDDERLNVHGGSIALGHPFAATGGRQALTMANELNRRGEGTALITQCAAGGLGAALVLEL